MQSLPLPALVAIFVAAGAGILILGIRLTGRADRLADRTGLGEAMAGGILLGAATSLSGTVVSVTTALHGDADLAMSNAVGGIAAQTAFLALADLIFRRANLEHAAAELTNIIQGLVLMMLLALPLIARDGPAWSLLGVHPVSLAIPMLYLGGLRLGRTARETPMWRPVETAETRYDEPEEEDSATSHQSTARMIAEFTALVAVMGLLGWVLAQAAEGLVQRLGLASALVGALMTAVVTSMPELVTTMAAVRRGALQLAVGGIIGGNTFDCLFLTASDIGYRDGSIYHAASADAFFWIPVSILMTALLLAGLVIRERRGVGGIGFESAGLLAIWGGAIVIAAAAGLV